MYPIDYYFSGVSQASTVVPPVDPTDPPDTSGTSTMYSLLQAVQTAIQGLSTDLSIPSGDIVIAKVPDFENKDSPSVVITPGHEESMPTMSGTTYRDDVGYPVMVQLFYADNWDQSRAHDDLLDARRKVAAYFRQQPISAVPRVFICFAEPMEINKQKVWREDGRYTSAVVLLFIAREDRATFTVSFTPTADSIHYTLLEAVQTHIRALGLPDTNSSDVVIGKIEDFENKDNRTIMITPGIQEQMEEDAGHNLKDDVIYPVDVSFFAADNRDQDTEFSNWLLIREVIARHFRHRPLLSDPCIHTCYVKPGRIVDARTWDSDTRWLSTLRLLFASRESRGTV